MDLLTKTKFAKWAGKSGAAVSNALKKGRLETFQDTNMINTGSPKSQAFKSTVGNGQKNIIPSVTAQVVTPGMETETNEDLQEAGTNVLNAQAQKTIEEAALKKEQRLEKQLKNAVLMGDQVKLVSIDTTIMTWFDSWLNTNKRRFNGSFDEFLRMAFLLFENEQGSKDPDFKPHDISRPEIKRKWVNDFEQWQHEGNKEAMKRLLEIQQEQSKG